MKRFLSVLLTVAMLSTMFAGLTVMADSTAPTKTYTDVDFENWNAGTQQFKEGANGWAGATSGNTIQTHPESNGKILKIPVSTNPSNYYVRYRLPVESNYSACQVLWTEISVKYEGGFTMFGFGENTSANCIFTITPDGKVAKFVNTGYNKGINSSSIINSAQLELGKWYHFVAALDFTDENAATNGAPLYIWMNGELIEKGGRSTNFKPSNSWSYHKLWVNEAATEGVSVCLDNVMVYETAKIDEHAVDDFDLTVEDKNPEDDIRIDGNKIIAGKATVKEVKEAIQADNYVFVKNGVALSDGELAAGSVMTVNKTGDIGFKQYDVIKFIPQDIITSTSATDITASIGTANPAHPVRGMVNDAMSADADIYKANCTDTTTPLVVTISLDAYYELQYLKVYERHLGGQRRVTVELGKNGEYTTVATNAPLATAYSISPGYIGIGTVPFDIIIEKADSIKLTFTADSANAGQKTYEIWEIEAYGAKTGDLPKDILAPIGSEGSAVSNIYASIESSAAAHSVANLVDGIMTSDNYYKSKFDVTDDLEIVIRLNAFYSLSKINILERKMNSTDIDVTVELGKKGVYTSVAKDVDLLSKTSIGLLNDVEADAIRLTFKYNGGGEVSKYQIWEIEAYGVKVGDIPERGKISGPVGESSITSITTSIPTLAAAHPVAGMIDGNREYVKDLGGSDASLYKSNYNLRMNPLKVLLTFDGVYNVSDIKVFERRNGQNPVTVSVFAGLNGEFTELISDFTLTPGAYTTKAKETPVYIPYTDADSVMLVFENAGDYTGQEASYQISEIEVYGSRSGDVEDTGIIPGYSYWEETNNSIIVAYANATGEDIKASTLIAAYEGNKMVAVCKAREMTIPAGSVIAQYSMSVTGIKQEGRTYKAFVMDSLGGLKPLMKAEIIG